MLTSSRSATSSRVKPSRLRGLDDRMVLRASGELPPMTHVWTVRLAQQATPLAVAQRLYVHSRRGCQLTAAHRSCSSPGLCDRRSHPRLQCVQDRDLAGGNADMHHHIALQGLEFEAKERTTAAFPFGQARARGVASGAMARSSCVVAVR